MRFLPTEQKDQIKVLGGVAAAALAALYWMYPHATAVEQLEARRERVERLETANDKARRAAATGQVAKLKAEAARSRATLSALRRLVPTEGEVPALLEQVSTAARRAGLEIGGVQPEPVLAGESFDTYRYKVTLVGGYHPIAAFLANVGSLSRIVAPVTFQLLPAANQVARGGATARPGGRAARELPLQAQLTIQTYVMRTAPEPVDPNASGMAGSTSAGATTTQSRGGEVLP